STAPSPTAIYTLSLHDALPISRQHADAHARQVVRRAHRPQPIGELAEAVLEPAEDAVVHALFDLAGEVSAELAVDGGARGIAARSEEHTSELQSLRHLVCRLLL